MNAMVPASRILKTRRRHWFEATRSDLYLRVSALEAELSVAAALLRLREDELSPEKRSAIVTELQAKWRSLLNAEPVIREETRT